MQLRMREEVEESLGLYIHIPFCVSKCPYCDFNSIPIGGNDSSAPGLSSALEERYVSALLAEFALRLGAEYAGAGELTSIYFGGGTPSLLTSSSIERVLRFIEERVLFSDDIEITMEVNPATVGMEELSGYFSAGVNRLSIGVQSFHDADLKALGRVHDCSEALAVYGAARKAGFSNIAIDLIFGIPGQTLEGWMMNLQKAVALAPEHLSVYGLTLEEGTPMRASVESGEISLASEEESVEFFTQAQAFLAEKGYEQYEISNYALDGYRSRHNERYWRGGDWLGLGAGAHSYIKGDMWGTRSFNERDLDRYMALVEEKGSALAGSEELSREEASIEAVQLALRLVGEGGGVAREPFYERFGLWPEDTLSRDFLFSQGLLSLIDGRIALTAKGMLLSDEVY